MSLRDQLQKTLGTSFTIERELGGGGMSRVFVAEETRFGRRVVIKVLMPELVQGMSAERFEREIKLAAQLQQANIVSVIGAGDSDGLPYYTMPYVDGESLRARLGKGPLRIAETISVLRDVARALVYAHGKGVVHRDIKPENILLAGGVAVVTDFGIAKALSASKTDAPGGTLTVVGTSLGTPAYMAPEQAVGDKVDERADLYAFGVVAYEMLSGSHPFAGKTTAQQFITAHLAEKPADIVAQRPDTPPMLADLVMHCLAKEPVNRPESAAEILRVLEDPALSTGTGIHRRTAGAPRAGAAAKSTGKKLIAAGVVALLLAVVAIGLRHRIQLSLAGSKPVVGGDSAGSINTIAVIPFTNTGGKPDDEYFSDGMTDELAHALSRVPSVQVAGRTSSYSFKGKQASAQEIGKALNVAAVVEGSVRRSGDRLRVIAQLTNAANGLVLWSDTYESQARDVFAVQDEFTRAIVRAISPTLRGDAVGVAAVESRGTSSTVAYDNYLRGKFFLAKRNGPSLDSAIHYFEAATQLDPKFARAFAGLAQTQAVYRFYTGVKKDSLAGISAERALAIDSTVADAYIALGYVASNSGNHEVSDKQFAIAEKLDPNNPLLYLWRSSSYQRRGMDERALADLKKGAELDPLSVVIAGNIANEYILERRFKEARLQLQKALNIDSVSWPGSWGFLTNVYIWTGFPDSAVYAAERAFRIDPANPQRIAGLLLAYAAAGRWADVDRYRRMAPAAEKKLFGDSYQYLLVTSQHEPLLKQIEKEGAKERVSIGGSAGQCHSILDRLKQEARYIAAMEKMGVRVCTLTSPWPFPKRNDGRK